MRTLHNHVFGLGLIIFKMQELVGAEFICSGNWTTFVENGEMRHPEDGLLELTIPRYECAEHCFKHTNCREFLYNPTDDGCFIVELEQFPSPNTSYSNTPENTYYRLTKSDWCPAGDGYQLMSETGPCFKFFTDKKTWIDANQTCNSYSPPNSRFAIVDTEEKFLLMKAAGSAMSSQFTVGIFIGLSDHGGAGFRWADGSGLNYTKWGRSTGDLPILCASLIRFRGWKWYASDCDETAHYLCELTRPTEA